MGVEYVSSVQCDVAEQLADLSATCYCVHYRVPSYKILYTQIQPLPV
jgi:hypothetical protein